MAVVVLVALLASACSSAEAEPQPANTLVVRPEGEKTLVVNPEADSYVDASQPTVGFGSASSLLADGTPEQVAFLRFRISGLTGWDITRVRLRVHNTNASDVGGVVHGVSSVDWSESMVWADRPVIDGPVLGSFGAVETSQWYEIDLVPFITGNGVVSIALTSPSGDGVGWASRLTSTPPELIVEAAAPPDTPAPTGRISLVQSASRLVGESHLLTAMVEVNDGTGWTVAVDGTVVDVAIASGPGALSSSSCTVVANTGRCSVTLSSMEEGTTKVAASSAPVVGGVPVAVTTDGEGGRTVNASVRWTSPIDVRVMRINPEADSFVDASQPTVGFGSASSLLADGTPEQVAFLRFRISGLTGWDITRVRLRVHNTNASDVGGVVHGVSSVDWSESMVWADRPVIDGPVLGSFGAVETSQWYEIDLVPFITGDGVVSIALTSPSGDGVGWASRLTSTPPELIVEAAATPDTPPPTEADGLQVVADSTIGSSASTAFAGNARSIVTAGGRSITVHGSHREGLQLAWRDIGGVWQRATIGPIEDGRVLSGTSTGDWTASIAVGTDRDGREHAWLMWAGATFTSTPRPAGIVRLSDLDAPWGPTVGEAVTLDHNSSARAALAFDEAAGRIALVWTRQTATGTYEVTTGWVTDLNSAIPAIDGETVLSVSTSSNRSATVLVGPGGATYVVGQIDSDGLRLYVHPPGADATGWIAGTAVGAAAATGSSPSAVMLPGGDVLAAVDTAAGATVHRFSATGSAFEIELADPGVKHPALAAGGDRVVMVGIRGEDGYVVSRSRDASGGWADEERVEIGAEGGGNHSWPNPVRALDGRLRFIVQGPATDPSRTTVYWFQRVL